MIGKMIKKMADVQIFLGTAFLLVFFVVVSLQVLFRYIGVSAMWTEDISQYSFIWSAFMGASAMVYYKQHFAFASLKSRVDGRMKYIYDILVSGAMLLFVVTMAVMGWKPVLSFWNHRWIGIPSFKMGYVWLCIPLTGITCTIYLLHHVFQDISMAVKGGDEA